MWGRMESRACPTTLGSQMKTSNILHQCNQAVNNMRYAIQAMNNMRYAVQHGNQHAYEDHPATVCSSAQIFVGARRSHREGNAALASVHTLWLASMIAMLVYFRCQRQVKPGRPAQLPQGRQNPLAPPPPPSSPFAMLESLDVSQPRPTKKKDASGKRAKVCHLNYHRPVLAYSSFHLCNLLCPGIAMHVSQMALNSEEQQAIPLSCLWVCLWGCRKARKVDRET